MTYEIMVSGNVNQQHIDALIALYQDSENTEEGVLLKSSGEIFNCLNIRIEPKVLVNEIQAEIDPLFLGYLVLYMNRYASVKVNFHLVNQYLTDSNTDLSEDEYQKSKKISDRAFSLNDQIGFINNFLGFSERISFKAYWYKKESKEILPVPKSQSISQRFFPTILIDSKERIKFYFDKINNNQLVGKLIVEYFDKIREIIRNYKTISIEDFSTIEIFLLRLLLSDDNPIIKSKKVTKDIINYYIKYSNHLASGIKELALNIVEHSRIAEGYEHGIGVITGRIFDKERLLGLKGIEEKEYLSKLTSNSFCLDLNILDLGYQGIREKYIENIKRNWDKDKQGKLKINYKSDIQILEDKENFAFKDFYFPNTKTEHQLNKLISRYGIQYFTHILTRRFNALVKVVSCDENLVIEGSKRETKTYSVSRPGTSYNCIIPFESFNEYYKRSKPSIPVSVKSSEYTNFLSELYKHKGPYNLSDQDTFDIHDIILFNNYPKKSEIKYNDIEEVYFRFVDIDDRLKDNIFLIDAEKMQLENASDWLRLLSQIGLEYKNIIVYNIDKGITKDIIENRRINSSDSLINFWNSDSFIVFYSFQSDNKSGYKRYGATVLTGSNEKQYNFINLNVWKNHYSFYEDFIVNNETEFFEISNEMFISGNLKYFDLLIKNPDKYGSPITLFEISLQYALNKPLPENLLVNTNNKGYKIKDTHFRLGSKIHIESFYYAKRVFQNSFFTTPLAFILSDYIYEFITKFNSLKGSEIITEFTLLGYEDYSELILSTTRSILSKRFGKKFTITHNTFDSKGSLSRPLESIQKNILIIVPIASTFSTSIKIKNELTYIFKRNDETKDINYSFLEPHLNLILVGHNNFEIHTEEKIVQGYQSFNLPNLTDYGWNAIDKQNKVVKLMEFGENSEAKPDSFVYQKYFIPVYSTWNKADDCIRCFPKQITDEKCLVETGQSSITPKLIFGLPKTKKNKNPNNYLDLSGSLYYGNLKKGNSKYLYFTRIGEIINKKDRSGFINLPNIITWLEKIKKEVFTNSDFQNKKIVLVTPSSNTTSNFIDLVNEHVFNYTANCLTISLQEDYIENSESLYADGLYKAEEVIFVDDVLSTTKSFLETNYIIKYIRRKLGKGSGIDFCVTLINRMTFDSEENVLLKLAKLDGDIQENLKNATEKLLYFTKINNPNIEEPNGEFPLESESKRYKILSDTASLDSIRSIFFEKYKKLKEHDLSNKKDHSVIKKHVDDKFVYGNKKLYQLLILDKLFSMFEYDCQDCIPGNSYEDIEDEYNKNRTRNIDRFFISNENPVDLNYFLKKIEELTSEIRSEFFDRTGRIVSKHKVHEKILLQYDHNLEYVILKIICSTPLIYYKQIRESAFYWLLAVLEKLRKGWNEHNIIGIDNLTEENMLNYFLVNKNNYYSEYQKLKFLLKRAVQLKSNYLIHTDFLLSVKKLINLLYENYNALHEKKEKSEEDLAKKIEKLFNSKYTRGHIELYEYVESLKKSYVMDVDRVKAILLSRDKGELLGASNNYKSSNKSDTIQFDDEDQLEQEFKNAFNEIKEFPKYRLITSKKLIYDFIALNQELVYQNEPKAIKLESNIDSFNEEESKKNGDFNHFLRLLKLENTAAIENFWLYLYDKLKSNADETIDIIDENIIRDFRSDPKFKSITPLIKVVNQLSSEDENNDGFDSFRNFLKLKAELTNLELAKTGNSFRGSLENEIIKILQYSSKILGDAVEECYLSVNYQYKLQPTADEIFFFDGYSSNKVDLNLYGSYEFDKVTKSLNYKMYSGIIEKCYPKYPLSNFEFIRKRGKMIYRDQTFSRDKEIEDNNLLLSPELSLNNDDCNILLVTLSDFTYNFPHSFWDKKDDYEEIATHWDKKDDDEALVTQAVLTFKLAINTRVDIKKIRLLLLLRSPLSRFINANILSNNMIEYINQKSNDRYQNKLGHNIDTYLSNQVEAFRNGTLEEIIVLNEAIIGQIKAYQIAPNSQPEIISVETMENRVKLLLESLYIYTTNFLSSNQCEISLKNIHNQYKIHKFVYKVVLTEIIINARCHGTLTKPSINVFSEQNYIVVKCKIDKNAPEYYPGKGIRMCQEIIEKYDSRLKLDITPRLYDEESDTYHFIVKIPLANETD